jgi:BirA family transcriptional regulator, biotin operon repressor / biotin---[acetyl-CoA-carboxylase] ligase
MQFRLGPEARAAGYRIEEHDTIPSTNATALVRARSGDPGRLWIVSGHQSAGRGRRGNRWETPSGNLAATLLYVVDTSHSSAATLGFVAGLALQAAIGRVAPMLSIKIGLDAVEPASTSGGRLRLKWPNDVLLDGGKVAGILLEAQPLPSRRLAVAIGIGVNVISAPDGMPYPTSALATHAFGVNAGEVFCALSDAWTELESLWANGNGFSRIRDLWLTQAVGLGQEVAVRVGGSVYSGTFHTIDEEGHLVVRGGDGEVRLISAGEVHFGAMTEARP